MRARLLFVAAVGLGLGLGCSDSAVAPRNAVSRTDAVGSPQLLACPSATTQQTTGVVGLLGGILQLGNTTISIPAGAVLLPTLFEIVVPASPYMEVEIHAVGLTSFLFHEPATISIDYSRCGDGAIPDGAQLQGVYIDPITHAVLSEMGGADDRAAQRVTFTTGHLSGYAVAY
jgi:hypothetical protein